MKFSYIPLFVAPLTLIISSCVVGPDFMGAEAPDMPSSWIGAIPPNTSDGDLEQWWQSFKDPQLTALIETAFTNNPDMIKAALSIASAEASLRSISSDYYPKVGAGFGGINSGSYNTSTSHGSWNSSLSASWSPDIWGSTRRQVEASFANLGSTKAAAASTRTALASSIANAYFSWISASESLRVAKAQLVYQERTYRIVQQRVATGFQSDLDLQESRVTIASTRASIPTYEANVRAYENSLALYLGTTIDQVKLTMPSSDIYNLVPRVPTNLPADLLRRRPDVIAAEADLAGASASIGVAVANLFPSISLTGSMNASAGSDFANFFSSATWSLAGSASQTIFNRTSLNEAVNIAELSESSAAQSYRKTVLSAFSEVEDELIIYARLVQQLPQYEVSADASQKAAELSLRQYNEGQTDFLNVATAERSWLSSGLQLIETRQQIRLSLARLCTAMGGGYELQD